jgi:thiol-disulfide isomerase/thioredoxin
LKYFVVKFYTRAGCHLCDEARPVVEKTVRAAGGVVEEVDIDDDDLLTRDYGVRVPVVIGPGDVVLAEGVIEARTLRKTLRGLAR